MKSYELFDSRLALLETARFQDFENDYVVSGCAYIYEQVFGISITLLKRLLEYEGATLAASGSPRAILKESYRFYDFIDEAAWLDMLRDRNTNVHIYDNKLAQDLILERLYPRFLSVEGRADGAIRRASDGARRPVCLIP